MALPYERCVGLEITDPALYQQYREAMAPILENYGGYFRYDFQVAETLRAETPAPINRIFILAFKDKASHDAFYKDPAYLKVREAFFNPAVKSITLLTSYERNRRANPYLKENP
jgi:uncharacterized protein (DUF1330 family)